MKARFSIIFRAQNSYVGEFKNMAMNVMMMVGLQHKIPVVLAEAPWHPCKTEIVLVMAVIEGISSRY